MIRVLQHLDDPMPLPDLGDGQREAILARGRALRRRRQLLVVGVPLAAAAVAATAVVAFAVTSGRPERDDVLRPASSAPALVLPLDQSEFRPADSECHDRVGDSLGEPDISYFGRDTFVLFHYTLVRGEMPRTGEVELRVRATSADGLRSRELVQRVVDGTVVEQYLRDPYTGARLDVPRNENPYGDPGDHGVGGARFPAGSLSGLGERWTWTAAISVDGTVVDTCDAKKAFS